MSLSRVFVLRLFLSQREMIGVGMWESRVLGEIPKSLWEPLLGFQRDVISIAVFTVVPVLETGIRGMLSPYRRADRGS